MNKVYLLLGSNLSDPIQQLRTARLRIGRFARILSESSIYQTEAWGKTDQPDFFNQVICISTDLHPEDLLEAILDIEKNMGRERAEKNAPRLIDIDILFYNELSIKDDNLVIPHPHLANRRFVLTPLHEIAANYIHPVSGLTVSELLRQCPDPLKVKRL